MSSQRSEHLYQRAQRVTPGGVNSPVRAFHSVGGTPRFIAEGFGPYLRDVDGNDYVDMVCSWGPLILGHNPDTVSEALRGAVDRGTSFGAPCEVELLLAEEIVQRIAPVDEVRLVNSGTEATMSALRVARAVTQRDLVVKFAGCYHGHVDALLASSGSGAATLGISTPDTPGVPESFAASTIVLEYNDLDAVRKVFAERGDQIACVITEAAPGNMGVVPPVEGFNQFLREITQEYGAVLISDEVMTGFRVSATGQWGVDGAVQGWEPDLMTFGKVIGGGLPLAAFGGKREVMELLAPSGPVYQAGTLSGNPLAATAGLTTLRACTSDVYTRLQSSADQIIHAVQHSADTQGVPIQIQNAGSLFSVFFSEHPVRNFSDAQATRTQWYPAFFHAMLAEGVYLPPSAFEGWFLSVTHDVNAVEKVINALPAGMRAVRSEMENSLSSP